MVGESWLRRGARRLLSRYPPDRRVAVLRAARRRALPSAARSDGPVVVAVQCVEAPFYFGLFVALADELRAQFGARGELVVVRSINHIGSGLWAALNRSALAGLVTSSRWVRAFRGSIDRVAYKSQSLTHPVGDLGDLVRSIRIWRRLRAVAGPFELDVGGVPVGDLIVDTFLRFRPSPRFDASDSFVLSLIWQAHRDVRRARAYFGRRKPRLYLTSYATYVQHGIAVRVALQEGVRVHAFSNFNAFGKRLSASDWFHTADARGYRRDFEVLPGREARLAAAEAQLRSRLAGGIDPATSYMQVSAYAEGAEPPPAGVDGAVVVFLHDFYDSPHVYADLVFQDFWAWVVFTIETLRSRGIPFYLKPHPNQISLSSEVLQQLKGAYPDLQFLSARVTNVQLVEAGMRCGVTMYGTVAHELAYLGVPTIACARHPHIAFDFCRTARSAEQYADFLRDPGHQPAPPAEMRRQALVFFYMHNLHGEPAELELRARFVDFFKVCHDEAAGPAELTRSFRDLVERPAFREFASRLALDAVGQRDGTSDESPGLLGPTT